jgi:hypothetical protein
MKHHGGDLSRVPSECHSIPNSHVLRQKAPAHAKHRDGGPFVKDPLLIRRDNDHKANSRIALAPGRCLVVATVRLQKRVSFFF